MSFGRWGAGAGGDILFFDNTLDEDDVGEMAGAGANQDTAISFSKG